MNKENLLKLADYLENNEYVQDHFDMNMYRGNGLGFYVIFYSPEDCGTVGCALGWSPFVDGLQPIEDDYYYDVQGGLCWEIYCKRVFGVFEGGIEWNWCFGLEWEQYHNTAKEAAQRIRYLVETGSPHLWFRDWDSDTYCMEVLNNE